MVMLLLRSLSRMTVVCALAVAVGACDLPGGRDATPKTGRPHVEPTTTSTATSLPPTAAVGPQRRATCELTGTHPAKVTVSQSADGLSIEFAGQPVPASGTAIYSIVAFDQLGEKGGQIGVEFRDGKQTSVFVADADTAEQTHIDSDANASADRVSMSIANANLGPLTDVPIARWSAALTLDGDDVGNCPDSMDYLPFPA